MVQKTKNPDTKEWLCYYLKTKNKKQKNDTKNLDTKEWSCFYLKKKKKKQKNDIASPII